MIERGSVMTWDMFHVIIMVMTTIWIVYSVCQLKNGPTQKYLARFEKYYGRTMTEADIKSYKNGQKFVLFALTFSLVFNIIF